MAKTKQKKVEKFTVSVWEAFVCTCPNCDEMILIREPVRDGDTMTCPNCDAARLVVDGVCASCRDDEGVAELNPDALGSFM